MNRLYTFGFFVLSFFLLSYSNGPAGLAGLAVSGAPGESQTCGSSSCHSGNAFDQITTIKLIDADGVEVDSYVPDTEYQVQLSIDANTGEPSAYGFQMVALAGDDNSGSWGTLPEMVNEVMLMDRSYVEHARPRTESMVTIPWTSPSEGTGDIDFYATGNAINRDGGTSGDDANTTVLTMSEGVASNTEDLVKKQTDLSIYPNPTFDNITITLDDKQFQGQVALYSILGKEMVKSNIRNGEMIISMDEYDAGIYLLTLIDIDGNKVSTRKVIKK